MTIQHLRSSTANKRPTPAAMSDGQLAVNTNTASPGLFFKDSAGALIKVGPVHVGTTAPNASPASGGETGNTVGEQWLDTTGGTYVFKVWDGSAWRSESGTFVDVNGDVMTGALVMDNQQQVRFRETTANGTNFIAIQAPASVSADRTLTLPDVTGTLVSTGDTGSVTSTMIADGTIVNADINASAAIAGTKISPDFGSQNVSTTGTSTSASFIPTSSTPPANGVYLPAANSVAISTNGTKRIEIQADGDIDIDNGGVFYDATNNRLAIGTTGPIATFDVKPSSDRHVLVTSSATYASNGIVATNDAGSEIALGIGGTPIQFFTGATERARIDSSGRLLVGTSSARSNFFNSTVSSAVHIEASTDSGRFISLVNSGSGGGSGGGIILGASAGTNGLATGELGIISFQGNDGAEFVEGARIEAIVDGTSSANDMPGRLVFSVTADGASSPTEAVRISQNRVTQFQNDIIPGTDNAYQVGQSGRRWSVIFAGTGTINTSDANLKQDIEDLEQAELNVATTIKGLIKKFRFIDAVAGKGDDARIHVGVIAQEVEQAFIGEGLDPRRYGLFCEDTLEDGSKRLGIRYDELLAFVIAAL
jgi:hypothetical protein